MQYENITQWLDSLATDELFTIAELCCRLENVELFDILPKTTLKLIECHALKKINENLLEMESIYDN